MFRNVILITARSIAWRRGGIGAKAACILVVAVLLAVAAIPQRVDADASARGDQGRLVFAHYVLCCTAHGPWVDRDRLTHEIALAGAAGLDGFVVNIGAWNAEPVYRHDADAFFAAAEATADRFKLFLSVDASGGLTPAEAADIVMRYKDSAAYLRIEGKPVVSSFATRWWWNRALRTLLRQRGAEILFLPHMVRTRAEGSQEGGRESPDDSFFRQIIADDPELDGYFYFGAAGDEDSITKASRNAALVARENGKLYIAPVTPYYLGHGPNNRVFDNAGFESLSGQWRAAIDGAATLVELVTWNDWEEQTYLRPLGAAAAVPVGQWGSRAPHDGFLEANRLYIDWFKTGRPPPIRSTRAFVAFRPDRLAICAPAPANTPCPLGWPKLSDTLYVTVEAAAPTVVTVESGANEVRSVTVPPGRSDHRFPLRPGPVRLTLASQGRQTRWQAPVEFGGPVRPDRLNMAAFTVPLGD